MRTTAAAMVALAFATTACTERAREETETETPHEVTSLPADATTPPPMPPSDASRTPSGAAWTRLADDARTMSSSTPALAKGDVAVVRYAAWTADGRRFDEERDPIATPWEAMMPAWRETLGAMTRGERRRVWAPASTTDGVPKHPEGALVFDLELVDVIHRTAARR